MYLELHAFEPFLAKIQRRVKTLSFNALAMPFTIVIRHGNDFIRKIYTG